MSNNYYTKILAKLNSQLSSILLCSLDRTNKFDKELYTSVQKTTHYIKYLEESSIEPTEEDMIIIEALTTRNQSLILPIMFAIFIGSFSISTFNAIFTQNYFQLIIGIVIIISILIFARILTNSQNPEIFPYTLMGLIGGPVLDNFKISISKPILTNDFMEVLQGSSINLKATSFFMILIIIFILIGLNENDKIILFFRRSRFKKVFFIYQNYKNRIDELASIREKNF